MLLLHCYFVLHALEFLNLLVRGGGGVGAGGGRDVNLIGVSVINW